jgi:hypothetical protein
MSTCANAVPTDFTKNPKKIYSQYSQNIYKDFMSRKYGLDICNPLKDFTTASIRKEILDWQLKKNIYCQKTVGFGDGTVVIPSNNFVEIPVGDLTSYIQVNIDGCIVNLKITTNNDNYTHIQTTSSSLWVINHNLGYNPVVLSQDPNQINIEGTITYLSLNTLTIQFSKSISGTAYLS